MRTLFMLFIIVANVHVAKSQTKLSSGETLKYINKKMNLYYLAYKINFRLDSSDVLIDEHKIENKTLKTSINLSAVEIKLTSMTNGQLYLSIVCINYVDCIYSTKEYYHNTAGWPLSCTQEQANNLLNAFLHLQKVLTKNSEEKDSNDPFAK